MIKKSIKQTLLFGSLTLLTGCYGTLVGTVGGVIMGGPSLTGKLYDSQTSVATKIVGTPFSLVTGAGLGIFPGLWNGIEYDLHMFGLVKGGGGPETHDLVDPWHRSLSEGNRLFIFQEEKDEKPRTLYHPPDSVQPKK